MTVPPRTAYLPVAPHPKPIDQPSLMTSIHLDLVLKLRVIVARFVGFPWFSYRSGR